MSDTLSPQGLQHTRLPCPSLSPGVFSNSCPLSKWCHSTISTSVTPFTSCPQSFPSSRSSPMSRLFTSSGQSTKMKNPIKLVIGSSRFYLDYNFFSVLIEWSKVWVWKMKINQRSKTPDEIKTKPSSLQTQKSDVFLIYLLGGVRGLLGYSGNMLLQNQALSSCFWGMGFRVQRQVVTLPLGCHAHFSTIGLTSSE